LLTIPKESSIAIYTDTQAAIDSINNTILNKDHSRAILTLHNHSIILNIVDLTQGKHLNLMLIKVKGHSDDIYNDIADLLAEEAAYEALLMIV
jgi:ribonuclease HI